MIFPVIALLACLGCFFTGLAYWRKGAIDFLVAAIIWFGLAAGSLVVEIPYALWTGSEVIKGVQSFASAEAVLSWLFMFLGIVCLFQFVHLVFVKGPTT